MLQRTRTAAVDAKMPRRQLKQKGFVSTEVDTMGLMANGELFGRHQGQSRAMRVGRVGCAGRPRTPRAALLRRRPLGRSALAPRQRMCCHTPVHISWHDGPFFVSNPEYAVVACRATQTSKCTKQRGLTRGAKATCKQCQRTLTAGCADTGVLGIVARKNQFHGRAAQHAQRAPPAGPRAAGRPPGPAPRPAA